MSNPNFIEVNLLNSNPPSNFMESIEIKKEVGDQNLDNSGEYDDYGFELFHENIFRSLSANFDNNVNISEVNSAYEKLQNCFIENDILATSGESKISLEASHSASHFLKYRDIDDAFMDMVIDSNVNTTSKQNVKKINLKSFKENIFSMNNVSLSDNEEESQSKNDDTESSEGIDDCLNFNANSQTDHEIIFNEDDHGSIADTELDNIYLSDSICHSQMDKSLVDPLADTDNDIDIIDDISDVTNNVLRLENNSEDNTKGLVKEVRIVVEKLPPTYSDNNSKSDESEDLLKSHDSLTNLRRQVARKKTGGGILNSNICRDTSQEEKIIQQLSSKDGEFVPSVFDKMTRAGKRDFERALAESTANLVIQKTTQLIQEKIRQLQANDKEMDIGSSEDEDKESDIHRTAEIVTNTIIEFLSKNKSKKSEKLSKEISDAINNDNEVINNIVPPPSPTNQKTSQSTLNELIIEKSPDKQVDKEDGNIFRRITRESTRAITAKNKSLEKKKVRKMSETIQEIPKIDEQMIQTWEEGLQSVNSEATLEGEKPNRPETRQTKLNKENNSQENVNERRNLRPRRKCTSNSRNINKDIIISKKITNEEKLSDGPYIDGQFLIDSELNENPPFEVSTSDLNELSESIELGSANDESTDSSVLKVNADSTTAENLFPINDMNDVEEVRQDENIDNHLHPITSEIPDSQVPSSDFLPNDTKSNKADLHNKTIQKLEEKRTDFVKLEESSQNNNNKAAAYKFIKDSSQDLDFSKQDELRNGNLASSDIEIPLLDLIKSSKKDNKCENNVGRTVLEERSFLQTAVLPDLRKDVDSRITKDIKADAEKVLDFRSPSQSIEVFADSTSFLNYTLEDSFKLTIDESSPEKEEIGVKGKCVEDISKENITSTVTNRNSIDKESENNSEMCQTSKSNTNSEPVDCSKTSNTINAKDALKDDEKEIALNVAHSSVTVNGEIKVNDFTKETTQADQQKCRTVDDKEDTSGKVKDLIKEPTHAGHQECKTEDNTAIQASEKLASAKKPLTNEEKIAQLTKRDPRLGNDKKLANVMRRDPRIRNKRVKTEEEQEILQPQPMVLESPDSPDPEPLIEINIPVETNKEENSVPDQLPYQPELSTDNESSKKKRLNKKQIDKELLYKTPLSDLHESHNDRPTYSRGSSKKIRPEIRKERDEEIRLHGRNRPEEEINDDREYLNQRGEEDLSSRYKRCEFSDDREFMYRNTDEKNRRNEEQYYSGNFEDRNFYDKREQDYQSGSRDDYEQRIFERRPRNEEVYNRRDFKDKNRLYSRNEFYRRGDYPDDHDNSFSRFNDRTENSFYNEQQDTYGDSTESAFRDSAYPPESVMPQQLFNAEEDIEQRYNKHIDEKSFSPPSSELCPKPPLLRTPAIQRDTYSPPRSSRGRGRGGSRITDGTGYDEDCRSHYGNYERGDQRNYRGRYHYLSRESSTRNYHHGEVYYRRGNTVDYRRREDSPPRKRFASEHVRDDERGGSSINVGSRRRSPSWSPDRSKRWSPEFCPSPESRPWDSPVSQQWQENYHDRASYKNYHRY